MNVPVLRVELKFDLRDRYFAFRNDYTSYGVVTCKKSEGME